MVPQGTQPERLREPAFLPMWKETEQHRNCSVYGGGTDEFHQTVTGLLLNDPEMVRCICAFYGAPPTSTTPSPPLFFFMKKSGRSLLATNV